MSVVENRLGFLDDHKAIDFHLIRRVSRGI